MSFFVAKNIIKNYANHRALDDVSIEIICLKKEASIKR